MEFTYSFDIFVSQMKASSQSIQDFIIHESGPVFHLLIQWNLSVTTSSMIKFITCDLFGNVFQWWLKVPFYSC